MKAYFIASYILYEILMDFSSSILAIMLNMI